MSEVEVGRWFWLFLFRVLHKGTRGIKGRLTNLPFTLLWTESVSSFWQLPDVLRILPRAKDESAAQIAASQLTPAVAPTRAAPYISPHVYFKLLTQNFLAYLVLFLHASKIKPLVIFRAALQLCPREGDAA